jgi:acyl-CoA reductase-like NAD-dependent aldehyde dehydrogenase
MRERRMELAALAVLEAGKPWPEADADVCEAIDFLEYYARGAIELEARAGRSLQLPGERNTLRYFVARRRGGDLALELPARDSDGHDLGRARDR